MMLMSHLLLSKVFMFLMHSIILMIRDELSMGDAADAPG